MTFRQPIVGNAGRRNVSYAVSSQPDLNLAATTLATVPTKPKNLTDFPNPYGRQYFSAITSQSIPNTAITTLFGQDATPSQSTGLPNPWGRPPLNTGFISGFNNNLEGNVTQPTPKNQYDFPNPLRPRGLIADQLGYTDASEFWLFPAPPTPNRQTEWPNPVLRAPWTNNLTYLQSTSNELKGLSFTPANSQLDWPNPVQRTTQRQSFTPPQPLPLTSFVAPVSNAVHNRYFLADFGSLMSRR